MNSRGSWCGPSAVVPDPLLIRGVALRLTPRAITGDCPYRLAFLRDSQRYRLRAVGNQLRLRLRHSELHQSLVVASSRDAGLCSLFAVRDGIPAGRCRLGYKSGGRRWEPAVSSRGIDDGFRCSMMSPAVRSRMNPGSANQNRINPVLPVRRTGRAGTADLRGGAAWASGLPSSGSLGRHRTRPAKTLALRELRTAPSSKQGPHLAEQILVVFRSRGWKTIDTEGHHFNHRRDGGLPPLLIPDAKALPGEWWTFRATGELPGQPGGHRKPDPRARRPRDRSAPGAPRPPADRHQRAGEEGHRQHPDPEGPQGRPGAARRQPGRAQRASEDRIMCGTIGEPNKFPSPPYLQTPAPPHIPNPPHLLTLPHPHTSIHPHAQRARLARLDTWALAFLIAMVICAVWRHAQQ